MRRLFFLLVFSTIAFAQSPDTIDVFTGWNLFGAVNSGAVSQIVNSIPPGIITTSFFGFNQTLGYHPADTLKRSNGYWVKVTQNGKIIIGPPSPTFICGITQVNYSGKYYNTVQIGSQCWLKENLDVGTYINGAYNAENNGVIEKYCYDNTPSNCAPYGGLYQWNEAMQYVTTQGTQGICPSGWHIPTLAEFQALLNAVGGDGNALKAVGQGSGIGAGTNTSGFSALLAGFRYDLGTFMGLGGYAYFWSSTEYDPTGAYNLGLNYLNSNIDLINYYKEYGFSVRCLRD